MLALVAPAVSPILSLFLFFQRIQNRKPAIPTTASVPNVAPIAMPATAPPDSPPSPCFGVFVAVDVTVGATKMDVDDAEGTDDDTALLVILK